MLLKWLAVFFQHGINSVAAILAAVGAIWWIEPTTKGGTAFLFFMVFIVVLAAIEIALRIWRKLHPPPQTEAEPPAEPIDAPKAGTTGPTAEVTRSREP